MYILSFYKKKSGSAALSFFILSIIYLISSLWIDSECTVAYFVDTVSSVQRKTKVKERERNSYSLKLQ